VPRLLNCTYVHCRYTVHCNNDDGDNDRSKDLWLASTERLKAGWYHRHVLIITGPPNCPVLFCWLAPVVVVYLRRLSSSVTLPAYRPAGRHACGRLAHHRPGAWVVGRPTLHGEPVRLRPVSTSPCHECASFLWTGMTDRQTDILHTWVIGDDQSHHHRWIHDINVSAASSKLSYIHCVHMMQEVRMELRLASLDSSYNLNVVFYYGDEISRLKYLKYCRYVMLLAAFSAPRLVWCFMYLYVMQGLYRPWKVL